MLKKLFALAAMLYAAASFAAVDVNKATAAELDSVKGIGPSISAKIIDERKKGNFKDWDDFISRVKGIGEKNSAKFTEAGLTVNGSGFKGAAASAKASDKPAAGKKEEKPSAAKEEKPMKADAKDAKPAADKKADAKADKKDDKKEAKADKKDSKADKKADAKDEKKDAKK
jgi:competence protein ComEA